MWLGRECIVIGWRDPHGWLAWREGREGEGGEFVDQTTQTMRPMAPGAINAHAITRVNADSIVAVSRPFTTLTTSLSDVNIPAAGRYTRSPRRAPLAPPSE